MQYKTQHYTAIKEQINFISTVRQQIGSSLPPQSSTPTK